MKYGILIFCFCLLTGSLLAQQLIGVRGGYGQHGMQFNATPKPEQQWEAGLGGGVVFRTLSSPHLGLQLELLMEQKGWYLFPGTDNAYQMQEQHLMLPVQSVVMVGNGRFQLVIGAGAFASYILSEKIMHSGEASPGFKRQPMQDWHYGLLGSLGPAVRIGRNWLQLEGRFSNALSNRLEPNLAVTDAYNLSWQQSVTLSLVWLTQLGASPNTK